MKNVIFNRFANDLTISSFYVNIFFLTLFILNYIIVTEEFYISIGLILFLINFFNLSKKYILLYINNFLYDNYKGNIYINVNLYKNMVSLLHYFYFDLSFWIYSFFLIEKFFLEKLVFLNDEIFFEKKYEIFYVLKYKYIILYNEFIKKFFFNLLKIFFFFNILYYQDLNKLRLENAAEQNIIDTLVYQLFFSNYERVLENESMK